MIFKQAEKETFAPVTDFIVRADRLSVLFQMMTR